MSIPSSRTGARAKLIVAGALTALLVSACAVDDERADGEGADGDGLVGETVANGLEAPWSIAFWNDNPLVSERDTGRILEIGNAGGRGTSEVAVIDDLLPTAEGGLLGLTVHDDHLYVYSTRTDANEITRYPLRGEPGSIELGEEELLLGGIPLGVIHNGGRLAFGPDGMLYATTGDASEPELSQSLDDLGGKILRMTPDGEIPDDNPFPESYVYSYGHRNSQGIAWAPDGTMYASEFGADAWDELNIIEPGGNYGWPVTEGAGGGEEHIDPVQQWPPADSSPSGIATHEGQILVATLRGQSLYEIPLSDTSSHERHLEGEVGRIRDVVTTPGGELWILTNNTDGRGAPGGEDDRILQLDMDAPGGGSA